VSPLAQPTTANAPMTSETNNSLETILIAYLLIASARSSLSVESFDMLN
jgi:hypothetical protein